MQQMAVELYRYSVQSSGKPFLNLRGGIRINGLGGVSHWGEVDRQRFDAPDLDDVVVIFVAELEKAAYSLDIEIPEDIQDTLRHFMHGKVSDGFSSIKANNRTDQLEVTDYPD